MALGLLLAEGHVEELTHFQMAPPFSLFPSCPGEPADSELGLGEGCCSVVWI